ncbi:hypothetical protein BRD05_02650 [Halobacteriales archaeon QS_9_70_65]|nr:MAG: hypothetical protein BRD05_02650 [Halobacteriales archaeon QS_9_70_65]
MNPETLGSFVRKTRGVFRDDERLRLSNHRKGRQADGTARVRPRSNRGRSSDAVSGAVRADTASLPGRATRHTLRGAEVPSTNRSTPTRRNLASVGVGTGPTPTPSARKPRRERRGGCHLPVLFVHIGLAVVCVPFVFYALLVASTRPVAEIYGTRHRTAGRVAASLWLVSFSMGVVIYAMLYHLF